MPGAFQRRRWHVIGSEFHPVAEQLRARSAAVHRPVGGGVAEPLATAVLLGAEFRWQDNALLLDGIAASLREGGRLALIHLGAGGSSLLRVAGKENPALDTVSIQLHNPPSARAIRVAVTLANAMSVGAGELNVDNSGVITRTAWEPVPLPEPLSRDHRQGDCSVLVTGGLGGLGLRAAMVLSQRCGLHPVLVDTLTPEELPADAARHLERLRSARNGVTVLNADVTDEHAIASALSAVNEPPITAVVHCAGLLHAGPVTRCASDQLAAMQAVKVHGLRNVLATLNSDRLRHLIAFGSITAEDPHHNMGGYALANELLWRTTLQAARSLPGCATVAAQWSLWSGAGMAHQAGAVPQARSMGMTPISLRSGMVALVRLMSWPVGPTNAARLLLR
jgi:NAD(P)-dependent dehydrogenase (short-subunit alcohol dehydrogenase family)